MDNMWSGLLTRIGYLWYLMNPKDHMFDNVEDVPDYYKEATPAYIVMLFVEEIVRLMQGKRIMRLNDSVANISQGIIMELFKIPLHGVEVIIYIWVYENFRICTLPWDSVAVWFFSMVACDFCFYWSHRSAHQISILWAFHEIHHSSEDFNLTIPLRLTFVHNASLWVPYLPMALGIPPPIFFVHYQMNVVFQFWLHTEVIQSLGIVEYIFITPSLHRVHHGRNRRCIDKNFGSIFSVWDRMFGTFEPEGKEKIHYGITTPLKSFNPINIQFNHFRTIWNRVKDSNNFLNKVSFVVKGPGWFPGKPWLGSLEDIPEPKPKEQRYSPRLSWYLQAYVLIHATALVVGHFQLMLNLSIMSRFVILICSAYIIFTTITLGCILDISRWAYLIELLRCVLYFLFDAMLQNVFPSASNDATMSSFRYLFFSSIIFWLFAVPIRSYGYLKKYL